MCLSRSGPIDIEAEERRKATAAGDIANRQTSSNLFEGKLHMKGTNNEPELHGKGQQKAQNLQELKITEQEDPRGLLLD